MPHRAAILLLAAALALASVLGGCENKKTLAAQFAHDDAVVSGPPLATHYELNTLDAKVAMTLPPGIDRYPVLHAKLFADGKQELLDFVTEAIEDRQRFARKGVKQASPYERRVVWTITAVTPNLVSLRNRWFDDTGGAHPDHGSDVLIWDRVHNVQLLQSDLFRPDVNTQALDALLCQKITVARQARLGPADSRSWSCPTWSDSHAVLVPSTRPYRIGGMMFLFDPYVIGAYAEGEYELLIPLSDFKSYLAPQWAADFVGAPAPSVRPKP
jgi:hypothetical protein